MICSFSKEKGVLQKQHSTNLITACCCLSPHNGSASRPGVLPRGLTHGAQPGGRLEKAWRLKTLHGHATGKKFNSRDIPAHCHCGTRGEVGIAGAVHLRVWEKKPAVGGIGERLMTSHRELTPGDSKYWHSPCCRLPCGCLLTLLHRTLRSWRLQGCSLLTGN